MDIFEVLEELETMVENSSRIPVTGKLIINADVLLEYIDRLRATLPEEIRQARWIKKEKDRLLQEAQQEAQKILEDVGREIDKRAGESEVFKQAEEQSREILRRAETMAREMRQGAIDYAEGILEKLEENLDTAINNIRLGRSELSQFKQES
jgi:vacuolar-type H+-ATPase subunit H